MQVGFFICVDESSYEGMSHVTRVNISLRMKCRAETRNAESVCMCMCVYLCLCMFVSSQETCLQVSLFVCVDE